MVLLCRKEPHRWRLIGHRGERTDECTRFWQREMGLDRSHIGPFFNEHDPVGVLRIAVAIVGQAAWLCAGALRVRNAQRQSFGAVFRANCDAACDDYHSGNLAFRRMLPSKRD